METLRFRSSGERPQSATNSVSFLGLIPPLTANSEARPFWPSRRELKPNPLFRQLKRKALPSTARKTPQRPTERSTASIAGGIPPSRRREAPQKRSWAFLVPFSRPHPGSHGKPRRLGLFLTLL